MTVITDLRSPTRKRVDGALARVTWGSVWRLLLADLAALSLAAYWTTRATWWLLTDERTRPARALTAHLTATLARAAALCGGIAFFVLAAAHAIDANEHAQPPTYRRDVITTYVQSGGTWEQAVGLDMSRFGVDQATATKDVHAARKAIAEASDTR